MCQWFETTPFRIYALMPMSIAPWLNRFLRAIIFLLTGAAIIRFLNLLCFFFVFYRLLSLEHLLKASTLPPGRLVGNFSDPPGIRN
jgi:hypothetical protein